MAVLEMTFLVACTINTPILSTYLIEKENLFKDRRISYYELAAEPLQGRAESFCWCMFW